MAKDYNEVIENLKSLSTEEIEAEKSGLKSEFDALYEEFQNNKTREGATLLVALGNASDAINKELAERTAEESEITLAAEKAAEKMLADEVKDDKDHEAESTPNGDEDEDASEFATKDADAESDSEDEDKSDEDESFAAKKAEDEDEDEEVEVAVTETTTVTDSDDLDAPVVEEEKVVETKVEKAESDDVEDDEDEELFAAKTEDEVEEEDSEGGDSKDKENSDDESDDTESDSDMTIKDFSAPAENTPENKADETARKVVTITAAADVKGFTSGSEMPGIKAVAQAVLDRRKSMDRVSGGDGEYALVASFNHADVYGDSATLDSSDFEGNREKVESVVASLQAAATDPQAIVAAGGLYGPVETVYDIYEIGETNDRPVKAALPSFKADRGGIRFMTPPVMADLDGAVSVWTLEDDIAAAEDGGPTKPCIRIKAGAEITVYLEAMPLCLTFGNLGARAWPELVERHIALAMALQARFAETRLLTRIGALSTKVTTDAELGAARDILVHLEAATTGIRSRHRLDPKAPLKALFPVWFRNALRADLVKQIPGDGQDTAFNLVDATIDKWFAARNVTAVWFLDGEAGQVFGNQEDGELLAFPSNMIWYLFPEGTFLHLDGGVLDLGLVRDSTLNATNDYKIFLETFENVAKVGVESLRITTPVRIAGASASTVDTITGTVAPGPGNAPTV